MTNLIQSIKNFFSKEQPLPSGMFSYLAPEGAEDPYRLHLRVEEDGSGLLVINASTVLHLNQTAVEYAYHIIKQSPIDEVTQLVAKRYQIDQEHVRQDFEQFSDQIETIIHTPDLDPVMYLNIERQEPYSGIISAPYRLDCALTYRLTDGNHREHAPLDRVDRELTTEEWVTIINKAYNNGIPHLLFTGGEPTLRDDLPELLLKAEELGMVTGVITDGLKLGDDDYRKELLVSGLDHLMVIFNPDNTREWHILEKVLAEDVFTTVHLTLNAGQDLKPHIKHLVEIGANALSLSVVDTHLTEELQALRDFAAVQQLELVWDIPVPYSSCNPVALELAADAQEISLPQGAGNAWLYVEPDGDVLPTQGMYNRILGNILTDPWDTIWNNR